MTRSLAAALLAALMTAPAPGAMAQQAQTPAPAATPADTWVLTRLREGNTLLATAPFSNGVTVVARCSNNLFALILAGLPEPTDPKAQSRSLTLLVGDDAVEKSTAWSVATDRTAAFSRLPAPMARRLAQGGALQIIVPAPPNGRRTRYVMDLTESVSAVQEVLSHCGRPLVDPGDEEALADANDLPARFRWLAVPAVSFPAQASSLGEAGGSATLTCDVNRQGWLRNCDIENEFPEGSGFGQAARRAAPTGRVALTAEGVAAGRTLGDGRMTFTLNFRTPPS